LQRAGNPEFRAMAFEITECGHHRQKDPGEEEGHLLDRGKPEAVQIVDSARRQEVGGHRRAEHDGLANEVPRRKRNRSHHDHHNEYIDRALKSPRLRIRGFPMRSLRGVRIVTAIEEEKTM